MAYNPTMPEQEKDRATHINHERSRLHMPDVIASLPPGEIW